MLTIKSRLLADAEFFRSRISKIDGAGDLGEHIVKVVQAKTFVNTALPPRISIEAPTPITKTVEEKTSGEPNGTKDAGDATKQQDVKA